MKTILGRAPEPRRFVWQVEDGVATVTLNRPERKKPVTFDGYAERRDTFRALAPIGAVEAMRSATRPIAAGPVFADGITKPRLHREWAMSVDDAITADAEAICMPSEDFRRAYHAFVAKERPKFEGN